MCIIEIINYFIITVNRRKKNLLYNISPISVYLHNHIILLTCMLFWVLVLSLLRMYNRCGFGCGIVRVIRCTHCNFVPSTFERAANPWINIVNTLISIELLAKKFNLCKVSSECNVCICAFVAMCSCAISIISVIQYGSMYGAIVLCTNVIWNKCASSYMCVLQIVQLCNWECNLFVIHPLSALSFVLSILFSYVQCESVIMGAMLVQYEILVRLWICFVHVVQSEIVQNSAVTECNCEMVPKMQCAVLITN